MDDKKPTTLADAQKAKDEERFENDKTDKPKEKTDITVGQKTGAPTSADSSNPSSVNVIPQVEGAVKPEPGKPIPNTEGRTASLDDHLVRKVDGSNPDIDYPDEGATAAAQAPDPLVLSGRAWDVARGADLMTSAKDASGDPGLQAGEKKPDEAKSESPDSPKRPATAPPEVLQKTLPPGAKEQPGGPHRDPVNETHDFTDAQKADRKASNERALRDAPPGTTDGGTLAIDRKPHELGQGVTFNTRNVSPVDRTLEPRPYLASKPDPNAQPGGTAAPRIPLPQRPVHDAELEEVHDKHVAEVEANRKAGVLDA